MKGAAMRWVYLAIVVVFLAARAAATAHGF